MPQAKCIHCGSSLWTADGAALSPGLDGPSSRPCLRVWRSDPWETHLAFASWPISSGNVPR